jgi:hypothetical protein
VKPSPSPSPSPKTHKLTLYIRDEGEGCPKEFIDPNFLGYTIEVTGREYYSSSKWIDTERTFTYEETEIINGDTQLRYSTYIPQNEKYMEAEYSIAAPSLPTGYVWCSSYRYSSYLYLTENFGTGNLIVIGAEIFTGELADGNAYILKIPD